MMKVAVFLFVCSLVSGEVAKNECVPDPATLCNNIKNALNAINNGAQQVSGGTDVEDVKKQVDGPLQASIINGNWTLLQIAADQTGDLSAKKCLEDTAKQSADIANFIDTFAANLTNDKDKVLDVQRTLRSVHQFYTALLNRKTSLKDNFPTEKICKNITDDFKKIESGAQRIQNGENVDTVKSEVDGPQLSSEIRYNYNALLLKANSLKTISKALEDCLTKTSKKSEAQVTQIEGIMDKLTDDKDKVNAVFKAFKQINELQRIHERCPTNVQSAAHVSGAQESGAQESGGQQSDAQESNTQLTASQQWGSQSARCEQDPPKLCANIKNALNEISSGAQQINNGTDVNEVKKEVDGPLQASLINGNWTLLQIVADQTQDPSAKQCLKDTAKQSADIANYIDTIGDKLTNDKDKVLDVQRTLRSVDQLNRDLQSQLALFDTIRINLEAKTICKNITDDFNKIDSGAQRIQNGENVDTVKSQVDGPQLSSEIRYNYKRLLVIASRIPGQVLDKGTEDCLRNTSDRAEKQVADIEKILDKLTNDKDKVNAVFKAFREINILQKEHESCGQKGLLDTIKSSVQIKVTGIKNTLSNLFGK